MISSATAAPHGLACLTMTAAGRLAEAVHQPPGRLGVVQVEVGQLLAAVLDGVVPPRAGADPPVAGALLVGVLAVAEVLGPLEGEVERGRQRHGRRPGRSRRAR